MVRDGKVSGIVPPAYSCGAGALYEFMAMDRKVDDLAAVRELRQFEAHQLPQRALYTAKPLPSPEGVGPNICLLRLPAYHP